VPQAGITKADMAKHLEAHGWEREPRKPGAALYWLDPLGGKTWRTVDAYALCKGETETRRKRR
jgi:hypothetical protein